jgi:uncharacterized membrane protein YqjE
MADDDRSGARLLNSAGGLAGSVLKLFGVRASFALLELADARDALLRVLLLGAVALAAALLGLVCLSALVVVLFWDALGWRILLILAVAYAALAALLMQRAMRIVAEGRLGLPVTMAELDKDRAAIFGKAAAEGETS